MGSRRSKVYIEKRFTTNRAILQQCAPSICGRSWGCAIHTIQPTGYVPKRKKATNYFTFKIFILFYESIKLQVWNHLIIKTNMHEPCHIAMRRTIIWCSSTFTIYIYIAMRAAHYLNPYQMHCGVRLSLCIIMIRDSYETRGSRPVILNLYVILN